MSKKLVVIGNGMAPGRVLDHLFEKAPGEYEVTIFNAEPRVNYDRIMLSPVLSGEKAYEDIIIHDDAWYEEHGVTLLKGKKVVEIDRADRKVIAEDGTTAEYDKLLIATGSSPFVIPVPGKDLDGVVTYRDLDDVDKMLDAWGIMDPAIAREIHRIAQLPGALRGATFTLELANMLAIAEHADLDVKHVTDAWAQLSRRTVGT